MIIAGIGSRKTLPDILDQLRELGALCREHGIWVRSGHEGGADYAWEEGALSCAAFTSSLQSLLYGRDSCLEPLSPPKKLSS